jgi:MFS family permease
MGVSLEPRPDAGQPTGARPRTSLRLGQLIQISVFWFATNAMWGGWEIFQQKRAIQLLGSEQEAGLGLAVMELLAMPVGALAMPIMGSISDYTTTRWGRRKPYILVGSTMSLLALVSLAFVPTFGMMIALFLLFQLATHVARGPFAGLVPDIVPEKQVGIASGLMGLMITMGLIGGNLIMMTGYLLGEDFTLPTIGMGVLIFTAGVATVLWLPAGPAGLPREGRSWGRIAMETFGTDLLRQRDYLFLLGSRFFTLMAMSFFMNLNILYIRGTFGVSKLEEGAWILAGLGLAGLGTAIGTIPGAKLSDRIGRKPVIYGSIVIGSVAMAVIGLAPSLPIMLAGVLLVGVAGGAFLAVDWALMTEIIPKAASGRYMGTSNIVEATNGPLSTAVGGSIIWGVGALMSVAIAGRIAMLAALVMFGLGALLLRQVHEPRGAAAVRAPAAVAGS